MQGIGFAQREELSEERHGTLVPRDDDFLVLIKPLCCLPQEGERKQEEPDGVSRNAPYGYSLAKLQKVLEMGVGILIRLATERASLHHVDEAGFELEVHVPNVDVGPRGHNVGGGDGELVESLFSHSLNSKWCFRNGFLCRENTEKRNDARSCPSHKLLWIVCVVFQQGETSHTLPLSSFKSKIKDDIK